ncbi:glycosyltransferase [Janthinobacterium sp. SUN100]|uniref:glycosyltransferase family 4 protein n=1 Tax=Janthinobacterium sp. SUN100 TaxID=3004101 RepID=UPI0025B04402|nr:glycosyltransferase [Janthinobacterium sp. SUN100]MDN2700377.1 glycosyltransferase [Janthinobacterium sp. SUN100]
MVASEGAKLLFVGHWSAGAGLTRVLERLALECAREADVRILGLVPAGGYGAPAPTGITVCEVPQCGNRFAIDPTLLRRHITEFSPGTIVVMGPAFLVAFLLDALQPYRASASVVLYLPVEGELASPIPLNLLKLVDICILYTEDTRARMAEIAEQTGHRSTAAIAVLGHGVDTVVFSQLSQSRAVVRQKLFPDSPHLHDAFIVLNSNRDYHRKRLDLTIEGFAEFSRNRPDAYLYLNVCGLSPQGRGQIEKIVSKVGATGKVLINQLNSNGTPLPEKTMNLLYNSCEVGVTTSMGEGWGLGTFEHAATGAAQIVPDHTSFRENWRGAAALLPPADRVPVFYEYSNMVEVRAHDVACELERLYSTPDLLSRMSRAAYERARELRFDWSEVGRQLRIILNVEGAVVFPEELPPTERLGGSPGSCGGYLNAFNDS